MAKKKKKIVFREFTLEVFTNGSVDMDGLDEFFNKRQRTEIMRTLRQIGARIMVEHMRQRR